MGRIQDFVTQNRLKLWALEHLPGVQRQIARVYAEERDLIFSAPETIAAYQQSKLKELALAASRTLFWADVFRRAGLRPEQVNSDTLTQLPFLTKQHIRERLGDLCVCEGAGVYENFSGGSTGIPIRFFQDERYRVHMSVSTRMCNEMAGAFPGARVAKLWGAPQDLRKITGPVGRAKLWLLNQIYLDTFDMGTDRMAEYHRQLDRFQPDLIQAYASSIHLFARYLRRQGIQPRYPRVAILSSAERLTPTMREEIEAVFPVRVFDRYGSREVSAIAAECDRHNGMHIHSPGYLVETIDPKTGTAVTGQPGEIAITVLNNHAMPFLRYRIGDIGMLDHSPCGCGRQTPRLRQVLGRTSDNFILSDGRIVHGEYFTHLFYGRAGVAQFQFEQEEKAAFRLRIVPDARWSGPVAMQLEQEIRQTIGTHSKLTLELCQEIPKTPSGKYRFTKSSVQPDEAFAAMPEMRP